MRIARKGRFIAFVAVILVLALGATGLFLYLRPFALDERILSFLDSESLQSVYVAPEVSAAFAPEATLTDPVQMRAVIAALEGSVARNDLFPNSDRGNMTLRGDYRLILTDTEGRSVILNIRGKYISLATNSGQQFHYWLLEPEAVTEIGASVEEFADWWADLGK